MRKEKKMAYREPSKFQVNVLSVKNLAKEAVLFLIGNGYDMAGTRLRLNFAPYGIVVGKDRKHYLFDNEGCGTFIPIEEGGIELYWCKEFFNEKGEKTGVDLSPCMETTLTFEEAMAVPVEKTVRLDEFIRTFGSRLENNFLKVERFLAGEIDRTGKRIRKDG